MSELTSNALPSNSAENTAMTDEQIEAAVFAVLRKWNDDRAWERYTRESGPYDVSSLRPEVLEIIRAVLAATPLPAPSAAIDGDAEYKSWGAELRSRLGPPLPACNECGGKGEAPKEGTVYICGSCWGCGVQMNENEYSKQRDWKLHDCPDGHACRADIGGGCASGFCAHFGLSHEHLHNNIVNKQSEA